MTIDNTVTKEEFQAYQRVQEKEKELLRYRAKNNKSYAWAAFSGISSLLTGLMLMAPRTSSEPIFFDVLTAENLPYFAGFLTLFNGAYLCGSLASIIKNTRSIRNLEKEMEQLKHFE